MKKLLSLIVLLLCAVVGVKAETYSNESATITWAFTSHESLGSANTPNDAFLSTNFTKGSNLNLSTFNTKNCTAGWDEYNLVYIKPTTVVAKNAADDAANLLEWTISPATGITFTPVSVSITACTAGGTGDPQVTIYAVYSDNTQETIQSRTNPNRPDRTGTSAPSTFTKTLENAKTGKFVVRAYLAGLTNTGKGEAFTNIVVTGKVSGTPVASTTYNLTVSSNDDNLGTVSGAGVYAENEIITLTATPKVSGYFVKWQKNGEDFSGNTESSIDVTVTEDASYTAFFSAFRTVSFSGLDGYKGTSGTGYATQYADASNKWTAPQNYYYASEGLTMTKWTDGVNDYVPGTEYTLADNITISPVFENVGDLSILTANTTVEWPFGTNDGAPTLSSEGNTQYYVQRAVVKGVNVDVPLLVNTTTGAGISEKKGKFVNSANYVQVNNGTVFKIPATKNMIVKYITNQTSAVTNIGFTDNSEDLGNDGSALTNPTVISDDKKTITYTYSGTADYLYLVDINGGKYPTKLSVTYPKTHTYVDVTSAGYRTFASGSALDFTNPIDGLTAYKATVSGGVVSFSEIDCPVPAEEGMLLKANEGRYYIPLASGTPDAIENAFVGTKAQIENVAAGIFVLMDGEKGIGFYKTLNPFTVGANTAYLPAAASARQFIGFDFNEATAIKAVESVKAENGAFNLRGQRVKNLTKGLYIVNGKKVVK